MLLLSLAYEHVGVTHEEQELIRSFVGEPDSPDLLAVPLVAEVPPPPYRFSAAGPANAPDPTRADHHLPGDVLRHGGHRLYRAWRSPLEGAPDGATWLYMILVAVVVALGMWWRHRRTARTAAVSGCGNGGCGC